MIFRKRKLMSIVVQGKTSKYSFEFYGDPSFLPVYEREGLDISLVENIIPCWVVKYNLTKIYIFFQDVWNFKNPFR